MPAGVPYPRHSPVPPPPPPSMPPTAVVVLARAAAAWARAGARALAAQALAPHSRAPAADDRERAGAASQPAGRGWCAAASASPRRAPPPWGS
eukprot:1393905-Prymnesium_polylepis.1